MTPRRKNDILLKGIIEEFFADMLRFFEPEADALFDLQRPVEFMDKELLEIMPETENRGGSRHMDMLAKVWLHNGQAEWVLVHIEIQGQNDPEFARRMFTYYYRTLDRFDVPITAFALFTGARGQQHPALYERAFLGTRLLYQYNTFHIFDRTEAQLLAMNNPFALVVLAAQKVVLSGKMTDDTLNEQRLTIARALIETNLYNPEKTERFLSFLKNFIYISNKQINTTFERAVNALTRKPVNMGIIDALKYISREEGREEGIEAGEEKATERFITNLILKFGYSNDQIAAMTDASMETIEGIRKKLNR